jgi:hypothetical protein
MSKSGLITQRRKAHRSPGGSQGVVTCLVSQHSIAAQASHPLWLKCRRPGRTADVSLSLIPLLRGSTEPSFDHEERRDSDLVPAIGIAVSVLISGLMWATLLWIV